MTTIPRGADAPVSALPQRVHQNLQGEFIPARWAGANTSGLTPRGVNVLVKMDQMVARTSGGIILPDDTIEKQNAASETGCVFGVGPGVNAQGAGDLKVGDRIYIEKYAGIVARGRDGLMYRFVDERNVGGLIDFGHADDETFPDLEGEAV